jgi:predicted HTH transcriptional regulator
LKDTLFLQTEAKVHEKTGFSKHMNRKCEIGETLVAFANADGDELKSGEGMKRLVV